MQVADVRARASALKDLIALCRRIKSPDGRAKYLVRRGAIDWASFDWESKKFGMAVGAPENFPGSAVGRQSTMQISVGTTVPAGSEDIDDTAMDEMELDVAVAIDAWTRIKFPGSDDHKVIRIEYEGSVEWHDLQNLVQGYFITYSVWL